MMYTKIKTKNEHNIVMEKKKRLSKWEGTKGAINAKMDLLLDYPSGEPDKFEYCFLKEDEDPKWETRELDISWFPDAFIGTMSGVMKFLEGSSDVLPTRVEDAIKTMAVAESAYISNDQGGVWVGDELAPGRS